MQVLRYNFEDGAEPLWPNASPVPAPEDIPPCPHCSSPRKFEFEVIIYPSFASLLLSLLRFAFTLTDLGPEGGGL